MRESCERRAREASRGVKRVGGKDVIKKYRPSIRGAKVAARVAASLALMMLALCASGVGSRAQSGRHAPKVTAQPTPEPTPQGESESQPRSKASKPSDVLVSFVVMEYDANAFGVDTIVRDDVSHNFVGRLGDSRTVSVTDAGRGSRKDARDHAKTEREAYVVLFQLDEETMSSGVNQNTRNLVIRTFVYAPQTGDLKYTDTTYQRPYQQTATVGGIPIPVPTHRIEQYPSQLQLEQAARDAADRILSRFNILPPER